MIEQTVLPFKLDETKDSITAHAGLALLGEFAYGIGLWEDLDNELPLPGSGAGYFPSKFVIPLVLMLNGGGRALEDLREIRNDVGLCDLLELEEIPSSDAVGDWLRRMGSATGLFGLGSVNQHVVDKALGAEDCSDYTLDIDVTLIEAENLDAEYTYKGFKGYAPMVGHLAENGLVLCDEFRQGNEAPASRNLKFLKRCVSMMPKGKRIKYFRSDSAAYQAELINYCEDQGIKFAIGADLDESVRAAIAVIPDDAWMPYGEGMIAETVHSMNRTRKAFRLIVIRHPSQGKLFEESSVRYALIASNSDERAEERLEEVKKGVGMLPLAVRSV